MPMTTAARVAVGDHLLGKTDIGALPDLFAGLLRSNPGDAGVFTSEVSAVDYARVDVTALFGAFADSGDGYATATNIATVSFGVPANAWTSGGETLAYIGYWDALTAGEMQYYELIPAPRTAPAGSRVVRWGVGKLKIKHR